MRRIGPRDPFPPLPDAFLVQGHVAREAHAQAEDGDAEDEPLDDEPDRPVDDRHEHRGVEKAQVVAHEDVGSAAVEPLESGGLDADAENGPADAHHPPAVDEEPVTEPEQGADENDGDREDRQQRQDKAGDEIAHATARY